MNHLMNQLKNVYHYSDYEIGLIRYALTALLYDCSKLIAFGIFYYHSGRFTLYLFALLPLVFLRTQNGGIHFKKYWSCFLFSFTYFELCIRVLPLLFPVSQFTMHVILLLCAAVNWFIGPNSLTRKTDMGAAYKKKARRCTFLFITGLEVLLVIYSQNNYLAVSFWTVVLHTVQSVTAKILKEYCIQNVKNEV